MKKAFHDQPFSDSTMVKLEIFRRYVRAWLPVFLTKQKTQYSRVNIFDFFSGPGRDKLGVAGSPLIVQEEIKAYCQVRGHMKADIPVRMVFNDINADKVALLQQALQENRCPKDCCTYEFHAGPFAEALARHLPEMRRPGDANLVILDQCGVTEVVPQTVKTIVDCDTTDVLFFISSSFLRRFAAQPEMQSKFAIAPDLPEIEENDTIHRYICRHFRDELAGTGIELAPFSLKKGPNVYGVIFAASHLSGLERFLSVCWKLDKLTGQADFNIDQEPTWGGQGSLFGEKPTKVDRFERELVAFVARTSPDNRALYRFCLEQGFPSHKANEALRSLAEKGKLQAFNAKDGTPARKSSFYLTKEPHKVVFKSNQP